MDEHKKDIVHEELHDTALDGSSEGLAGFTPEQHRKIVHRVDRRLVVLVGVRASRKVLMLYIG